MVIVSILSRHIDLIKQKGMYITRYKRKDGLCLPIGFSDTSAILPELQKNYASLPKYAAHNTKLYTTIGP